MGLYAVHDSHREEYRSPFGAVPCRSKVCIGLRLWGAASINMVELVINEDGGEEYRLTMKLQEVTQDTAFYAITVNMPLQSGLVWYYFQLEADGERHYYGNNERAAGGTGMLQAYMPPKYQITVYERGSETPGWFKKAIMYQIFPDRFRNGDREGRIRKTKKNSFIYANWEDTPTYVKDCSTGAISRWDFFGGNLDGIMEKLGYLKQLGVSVIYMNPVFEASSNHRYDTGDYMKLEPMLGDEGGFRELCSRAKALDIAIILDGVFSHTGSDSLYFNKYGSYPGIGAYQSSQSPYHSWYRFKDTRDDYECWWGVDSLPNVYELDPGYVEFIITGRKSVIKHWMDMGAAGWRLDVADELPDEFIRLLRKTMKEKKADSILLGEVWEDASNKESYGRRREYLLGEELDSVMNYPFRSILVDFLLGKYDSKHARDALLSICENYPLHNFYSNMNLIGSHDVPRILTVLGEAPEEQQLTQLQKEAYRLPEDKRALGVARLKLISLIQMTFPGVPSIYYGDEAGLEGFRDPLNRRTYPWGREDKELLEWYKLITTIRRKHDVFSTGKWMPLELEGDVFGYIRKIEEGRDVFGQEAVSNTALVLVNRSRTEARRVNADIGRWYRGVLQDIFTEGVIVDAAQGKLDLLLGPLQGKVFIEKPYVDMR